MATASIIATVVRIDLLIDLLRACKKILPQVEEAWSRRLHGVDIYSIFYIREGGEGQDCEGGLCLLTAEKRRRYDCRTGRN